MSIPLLTRSWQRYFDIIDHHCTVVIYEPTNIHHLHGQFHYDVTISNACHVCYIASLCERVEPVTLSQPWICTFQRPLNSLHSLTNHPMISKHLLCVAYMSPSSKRKWPLSKVQLAR